MEAVEAHDIVLLCGETGCGKTTQVCPCLAALPRCVQSHAIAPELQLRLRQIQCTPRWIDRQSHRQVPCWLPYWADLLPGSHVSSACSTWSDHYLSNLAGCPALRMFYGRTRSNVLSAKVAASSLRIPCTAWAGAGSSNLPQPSSPREWTLSGERWARTPHSSRLLRNSANLVADASCRAALLWAGATVSVRGGVRVRRVPGALWGGRGDAAPPRGRRQHRSPRR